MSLSQVTQEGGKPVGLEFGRGRGGGVDEKTVLELVS